MTNDAKLGLVVGVGLVIVVAVVFFRKEIAPVKPASERRSRSLSWSNTRKGGSWTR